MAGEFLAEDAPGFRVKGSQVRIISDPNEFYEELCSRAGNAQRRIVLSALYLGTGPKEQRLVDCIRSCLKRGEADVTVLLDYCRGNRVNKGKSSCTMLQPLVADFEDLCSVYLYHTPCLRGVAKKLMPQKVNETVGLQHCKVYLFDDSLIISGANLSNDYFTDRQDRYVLIEDCPKLADFFEDLIVNISEFSLQMKVDAETKETRFEENPEFQGGHPFEGDFRQFVKAANEKITGFMKKQITSNRINFEDGMGNDTWIFPSIQMGQIGVRHDSSLTQKFLNELSQVEGGKLKFATGYFNLTDSYMKSILESKGKVDYEIVMAHPEANSFYNAPFPLYGVACAYTHIAKLFFDKLDNTVAMYEYQRKGWTFHGKGMWYYPPGSSLPEITMVGSPNFGYRSVEKDLEAQITIVTKNKGLQQSMHAEQQELFDASKKVTPETFAKPDRLVPTWVKAVVGVARRFF